MVEDPGVPLGTQQKRALPRADVHSFAHFEFLFLIWAPF
jgi:hypothetical protein